MTLKRNVRLLRNHILEIKKKAILTAEVDNAVADNQGVNTEDLSNAMSYTTAISKTKDIKLSN